MARDTTKAELIKAIERKISKAKPLVKDGFVRGLKYQKKSELARLLRDIKVDRDGYGFRLR